MTNIQNLFNSEVEFDDIDADGGDEGDDEEESVFTETDSESREDEIRSINAAAAANNAAAAAANNASAAMNHATAANNASAAMNHAAAANNASAAMSHTAAANIAAAAANNTCAAAHGTGIRAPCVGGRAFGFDFEGCGADARSEGADERRFEPLRPKHGAITVVDLSNSSSLHPHPLHQSSTSGSNLNQSEAVIQFRKSPSKRTASKLLSPGPLVNSLGRRCLRLVSNLI